MAAAEQEAAAGGAQSAEVLLARDTRPTGEALLEAAKQVKVADRTAIETADAETRVMKPSALQELIDTETGGLSFLNPHLDDFLKYSLIYFVKIFVIIGAL